jgi:acetylornithine/succinyldiaminopimelate/putrescine aminotransferase/predicted amino acid dehydrogenase
MAGIPDPGRDEATAPSPLNPTLHRLLALLRMDRSWRHASGVWLDDAAGRRFLDCYAQYGVHALGHNAPVVHAAVRAALDSQEPAMVQPYRARHAEELARAITRLAPGNLTHGVFASSGAEAVEAAIKLARTRSGRPIILAASGSFHGKTMGALAVTGQRQYSEGFGPPALGFEFVAFGDSNALAERFRRDGKRIAAFFLEPIQGEGGVHLPPKGYLRDVRALCSEYGVALVLDEIQTGLGRTGKLFACEHEDIAPDILLLGKALGGGLFPLSCCFTSEAFWDEGFALRHSSTFANNNIACRVGLAVLETLADDGFLAEVARKGERLQARLAEMARRYPILITAVRGRALMSAIELRRPAERQGSFLSYLVHQGIYSYAVAAAIAELGSVLVLPTLGKSDVIRIAPPLVITDAELDQVLNSMDRVFHALRQDTTRTILRAIGAFEGNGQAVAAMFPGPPPLLPPRLPSNTPAPRFAFLIHYTRPEDVALSNPTLGDLDNDALLEVCAYCSALAPGVVLRTPTIRSITGHGTDGLIMALPLLPEEMARRGLRSVAHDIGRAVDLAAGLGVRVVGLGGYTAPYSRRGLAASGRGVAITTGNALTAGMAVEAIRLAATATRLRLGEASVAVVGARGSVGSLAARLLVRDRPRRLILLGNPNSGAASMRSLASELRGEGITVEVSTSADLLTDCHVILTATTAAKPVLEGIQISPGTILCDVAQPSDVPATLRARADLTVIEGGRVLLPDASITFGVGNLVGLPAGVTLACLAETILLALEGEEQDYGVGYDVPVTHVDHVMALAKRHGIRVVPPVVSHVRPIGQGAVLAESAD